MPVINHLVINHLGINHVVISNGFIIHFVYHTKCGRFISNPIAANAPAANALPICADRRCSGLAIGNWQRQGETGAVIVRGNQLTAIATRDLLRDG